MIQRVGIVRRLRERLVHIEQRLDDIQFLLEAIERRMGDIEAIQRQSAEIQSQVEERLVSIREQQEASDDTLARISRALRFVADNDSYNRERLESARREAAYEEAFEDPEPLVSVVIPTYNRPNELAGRAIPSALDQGYQNVEVIVVGDAASTATEEAVKGIGDPRVSWINLGHRGPYPDDIDRRWQVAGTMPINAAIAAARGRWIAPLNDDDAFRPGHIESLLENARRTRSEVSYGRFARRPTDDSKEVLGRFPPEEGQFCWQAAILHSSLTFMRFELSAAMFNLPGDWHLCERMLKAGVQFSMIDEVVLDYFPSRAGTASGQ
jgi:hypothetical protein